MTRINTNVQSLISRRALTNNNEALGQALERLSSGLRINTGRDDPAGLVASESLRASVRAITTAISNAVRADTIIKVAEGGLQEVSTLLLDLESLVNQSANEAGITPAEVKANQQQIDSILASVNRLADSVSFGDKKLLNGSMDFTTSGVNMNEATGAALTDLDNVRVNAAKVVNGSFRLVDINVVTASEIALVSTVGAGTDGAGALNGTLNGAATIQVRGSLGSDIISFASGATMAQIATAVNASSQLTGVSATASAAAGGAASMVFQSTGFGTDEFVTIQVLSGVSAFTSQAQTTTDNGVDGNITVNGATGIVRGLDVAVNSGGLNLELTLTSSFGSVSGGNTSFEVTGGGAVFSIAPTISLAGLESIGLSEVSTAKLGSQGTGFLSSLGSGLANDLSSGNFTTAQRVIREAVGQIASLRGRLGGFQKDTLASTIRALRISNENVMAAESAIRDADFAVETSALTRAQILVSSTTSVLQIANAQPQNALALLG